MQDVFGPGGALSRALPGFEPRSEQAALAAAVELALSTGDHLVAEAGTGTGKSLAYLIPALESGKRVVVATATKALQEQLLDQDVPAAARALGRDVRVVLLKGRQNYLCRKQLQGFGPMLLRDARDEEAYDAILPWLDSTTTGDRAELEVEPSEALWSELAVGSDRCAGRRCPFYSTCFTEVARSRAGEAELVIANHALYFADLAAGGGVLARARRRRLRRGAPARGERRGLARRARVPVRAAAAHGRRRASLPRGRGGAAGARARPNRALRRPAVEGGLAAERPPAAA